MFAADAPGESEQPAVWLANDVQSVFCGLASLDWYVIQLIRILVLP
jgi:hypothetical protein